MKKSLEEIEHELVDLRSRMYELRHQGIEALPRNTPGAQAILWMRSMGATEEEATMALAKLILSRRKT